MMDSSESDVVVWTESEERHAWWCEVLCIEVATSPLAGVAGEMQVTGVQPTAGVPEPTSAPCCRAGDAA